MTWHEDINGRWFEPGDAFTARAWTDASDGRLWLAHDCASGRQVQEISSTQGQSSTISVSDFTPSEVRIAGEVEGGTPDVISARAHFGCTVCWLSARIRIEPAQDADMYRDVGVQLSLVRAVLARTSFQEGLDGSLAYTICTDVGGGCVRREAFAIHVREALLDTMSGTQGEPRSRRQRDRTP